MIILVEITMQGRKRTYGSVVKKYGAYFRSSIKKAIDAFFNANEIVTTSYSQ